MRDSFSKVLSTHACEPSFSLWHHCEGWCDGIHLHASSGELGTEEPLGCASQL